MKSDTLRWPAFGVVLSSLLGLMVATGPPAAATLDSYLVDRQGYAVQTSDGAASGLYYFYLYAAGFLSTPGEFDSGTLAYPGPDSPLLLSPPPGDPYRIDAFSPEFGTQAAMDAAFPVGDYTLTASNSGTGGTQIVSVPYDGQDAYPESIPYLTGTTYSDLILMNPANPFQLNWNDFSTGSAADYSFIDVEVWVAATDEVAFQEYYLPAETTSLTIPGGTLDEELLYRYWITFSNGVWGGTSSGTSTSVGYTHHTWGAFVTAPEPSTGLLLAGGLAGLAAAGRRRSLH